MRILIDTTIAATAIAVLALAPAAADTKKEYVPAVESEALHKAPLPGVEGKEVTVMHITAPPGYVGERHQHTGPLYLYVLSGSMEIESADETLTIGEGEFMIEPVNKTLQPRNLSDSEPVELLIFQVGNVGDPMMIKAD